MSELLQEIEELAKLYFSHQEVELITGISVSELKNEKTENGKAFAKGRLLGKVLLRKTLVEMANNGSTEAIKQLEKIYLDSEADSKRSIYAT